MCHDAGATPPIEPVASRGFFDAGNGGHAEACADAWRRVLAFL
ncbi:hypothetical protein [Streptosporangium roseum]